MFVSCILNCQVEFHQIHSKEKPWAPTSYRFQAPSMVKRWIILSCLPRDVQSQSYRWSHLLCITPGESPSFWDCRWVSLRTWKLLYYSSLPGLSQCVTPVSCPSYVGVLAFLLFTERLHKIVEGPTSLNYYWVPFLVRTGDFSDWVIGFGNASVFPGVLKGLEVPAGLPHRCVTEEEGRPSLSAADTNPPLIVSLLWPHYFPKPFSPVLSHWGWRF